MRLSILILLSSVAVAIVPQVQVSKFSGGAVAHSVEHATPGEEVLGSIPAVAALSLLVGSVSV